MTLSDAYTTYHTKAKHKYSIYSFVSLVYDESVESSDISVCQISQLTNACTRSVLVCTAIDSVNVANDL